jgi:hypothetical protein
LCQELIPPFRAALEQKGRNFPKGKGTSWQKLQIKITLKYISFFQEERNQEPT